MKRQITDSISENLTDSDLESGDDPRGCKMFFTIADRIPKELSSGNRPGQFGNINKMLTIFFDQEGVIYHKYVRGCQTINKKYYLEVLKRLRDALRRKRPEL